MVRHYDLVRESEALCVTLLAGIVFAIFCTGSIVVNQQVVRDVLHTVMHREEKRKIEQPKPVVLPKDVTINTRPDDYVAGASGGRAEHAAVAPANLARMQTLGDRLVVKGTMKSNVRPKALTGSRKAKLDFKSASKIGEGLRGQMYQDYRYKHGVEGSGKTTRATIEKFVLVAYEGGDWDCECHHSKGAPDLTRGSLPNLVREIKRRTNMEVKNEVPVAVRADSPEIHKSPFAYFTGHKNFTLTEAEVENLRTYLLQGGAIVANSSLPGRRSRFDVAFRREMKRVIPDHDLKPIEESHDLYKAFVQFNGPPMGMNFWQEPIEAIEIDGRIVVIYNLNDYGDFMLAALDDTGNEIKHGISAQDPTYRWEGPRIWGNQRKVYANVEDFKTTLDAYMMNVNILVYLLTR